jgi:gamma-glutamyl hercynylcysteine S-oxide hydrolase
VCRHLGYLGAPRPVGDLLFDAPHALVDQGRVPREMPVARDNPDGWGIAWWMSANLPPLHYRSTTPMWRDTGFPASGDSAGAVLAAVRKASPGTTLRTENNAPFVGTSRVGPLAFSLNGNAFHESCAARVKGALRPGTRLAGDTDSEVLFALVRDRIDDGRDPAAAVAAVHHVIDPGPEVYVNLLLLTAHELVATTWQHTLYLHEDDAGVTVASEPLDADPAWRRVPDGHLLTGTVAGAAWAPLQGLR